MTIKTRTRVMAIRMPEGLYNRITELAHKNALNPSAWCVKALVHAARWKWEDTPIDFDSGKSDRL